MKIFSLDPSINDVGWAVIEKLYRDKDDVIRAEKAEWRYGNWKLSGHSFSAKLQEIAEYIIMEVDGLNEDEGDWVLLEWPAYFGSQKGQVSAQMGHTLNLAGIDGYVAGYFRLPWQSLHFITANQWKGSVSKNITWMRFCRVMGTKQIYKVNHNAVDAVMMLLEFCKRRGITDKITKASEPDFEHPIPEED